MIVKHQFIPPGVQNSSNSQSILRILGMLSTDTSEIHRNLVNFKELH